MSSKTKEIVETQKRLYEMAFHNRRAELKDLKIEDGNIGKDPQLRHLRAKVRQVNRRLLAISKIQKKIEASASRKREKAHRGRMELKSSKKSVPEPSKKKAKQEKATTDE